MHSFGGNDTILLLEIVMLKKILFTALTILVLYSAVIVGYKANEPEREDILSPSAAISNDAIDYSNLRDYTINSGEAAIHYYFFFSRNNQDCLYVANTVLTSVESSTGIDLDAILEYVDITSLEDNLQTSQLRTDWQVSSYPAFVTCRYENGNITIDNTLQWDPQHPLSASEFTDWLQLNGLYKNPNATDEPIATPAS